MSHFKGKVNEALGDSFGRCEYSMALSWGALLPVIWRWLAIFKQDFC